MTKIREMIQINSGYTSYVDLYEDYYDREKNRKRMERYKPITAHRHAFEKIANALNPKDRRFYFLSGSYGTGKSHLLLMLANYFANPSDLPEIEAFFKNYEAAQKDVLLPAGETLKERKALSLKEMRKSGRFLVAICRYNLNLDFEGTLLRALEEAIERDGAELPVESHYKEALRRIRDWEERKNEDRFYGDLEAVIAKLYPDWTLNDLIAGLEQYDHHALEAFKSCYRQVTDVDFSFRKDNLRAILSDLLESPGFKERYQGIVFIYDEFGGAIDAGRVNYTTLLDFAQYCANSTLEKGGAVIFIGSGHKAFRNHGQLGDLNAETLEARVTEIGLQTEGMEDIIAAIVQPLKDSPEWKEHSETLSSKFTWLSSECNRLKLFNWLPAPKIKNNIIQNIFPMHPLATYALLRLAAEAGSDHRSVFRFFSPEFETGEQGWINVQPYSYPWFIENHEIDKKGKLPLYTADLLVEYFGDSLRSDNTRLVDSVRNVLNDYEATQRELQAYLAKESADKLFDEIDELMERILNVMLVNEIARTPTVRLENTAANIAFALDCVSPEEKKLVENRLELLCDAGVLYNDDGVYEFLRSDRKNVRQLIEQFKANPNNRPTNLVENFLHYTWSGKDQFLEAKDYNSQFNEDKRLKVVFASPHQLFEQRQVDGKSLPYFTALEEERKSVMERARSYEGVAVYVFCESENDIEYAKKAIRDNDQARVVIAIPRQPIRTYDAIFTLKALESDWFKKLSESFSPYEKAEETKIREEAKKQLNQAKDCYFSNTQVYWFGRGGVEIPVVEGKNYDVANRLMQEVYGNKRNTFSHSDFNKIHLNISNPIKNILKEAGDPLCNLSQPIKIDWTLPENRGTTKYLRRCFVDHQILRVISTEGEYRYLEVEKDLQKFQTVFPAYAHLLQSIAEFEHRDFEKNPVYVTEFLKPYFEEFGQGEIAVTFMLLLARRYYGDSLRFKPGITYQMDIQFKDTNDMLNVVQGKYPGAVLLFEPLSTAELEYFAKLVHIFSDQSIPAGKSVTVNEAHQTTQDWWNHLPLIARSVHLYPEELQSLAETFSRARTRDPFLFIKYDLLEQLGVAAGEVLTSEKLQSIEEKLLRFKDAAESILAKVKEEILHLVAEVFNSPTHLDVDLQEALRNWYNSLSPLQRDQLAVYHNNDSKPLVKFTSYVNIHELLFHTLPDAYGFGSVDTWSTNQAGAYVQRIKNGKRHIEDNAPQVSQLNVQFEGDHQMKGAQVISRGELTLRADTEDGKGTIYYTIDGSDPMLSSAKQKLSPGETLTVRGNSKIRFVVADEKGNYGPVQTVEVIDEFESYKIKRGKQVKNLYETITFAFPPNKEAACATLQSLLSELKAAGLFGSVEELEQEIQKILEQLR